MSEYFYSIEHAIKKPRSPKKKKQHEVINDSGETEGTKGSRSAERLSQWR